MKEKMNKILILTVGSSCEPLVTAINMHKPEYVYFLCSDDSNLPHKKTAGSYTTVDGEGFPCKEWSGKNKPSIVNQTKLQDNQYEIVLIQNKDNLSDCYYASIEAFKKARDNIPYAEILADYTGGTKSMSSGLVAAALDDGEISLYIVGGERLDLVKVRSGSQRIMKCSWMPLLWRRRIITLKALFSKYDYNGCIEFIRQVSSEVLVGSEEDRVIQVYLTVAHAFSAWDNFNHEGALEDILPYTKYFVQHKIFLEDIIRTKPALTDSCETNLSFSPVYDVLLNAQRRLSQENFDDAVARTYRALELLAQICLAFCKPPIYTGIVDPNDLPEKLREKYGFNQMNMVKNKKESGAVSLQLGLVRSYELLSELNHPTGILVMSKQSRMLDLLKIRNESILAHGFSPINSEKAQEFYKFVVSLVLETEKLLGIKKGFYTVFQFPLSIEQITQETE
ncbi:TIGR02710 family CRISPR-associated CARF protein [Candidatus Contubernalis alkaliaceticus]|uniref:TIGR02710 family CRISPR-associated CARF protein n=1 Tax=Candidatus Contubernalis alkaliaceticus TaxID=338645 RepID=UPI001F4BEF63|nr:TIGR02710 family CRISPR-associated CARF protein [Candidatus Contubernalis alkalaceticus]UNC93162.1 TIGR02710 family CRISPR-associated protein [Candidatus Contubernalis alkalaceticus]